MKVESSDESVISLRRLDCMMDWIIACKSTGCRLEDSERSPFFVGHHRLRWATEDLEGSPFALLCRGFRLLIEHCYEMERDGEEVMKQFLRKFCSWCLASEKR